MKVRLHPINVELEGDPNRTLMQICQDNKIEIKSLCKGIPSCAECRVKVLAGEHNLIPPNKAELNLIGTSYYIDGRRLACQCRAFGDVSIDITEHLEKDDNSNKKIRGFRAQDGKDRESKAIQGTLILQESTAMNATRGPARSGRGNDANVVEDHDHDLTTESVDPNLNAPIFAQNVSVDEGDMSEADLAEKARLERQEAGEEEVSEKGSEQASEKAPSASAPTSASRPNVRNEQRPNSRGGGRQDHRPGQRNEPRRDQRSEQKAEDRSEQKSGQRDQRGQQPKDRGGGRDGGRDGNRGSQGRSGGHGGGGGNSGGNNSGGGGGRRRR